jgi:hypothetical protein
MREVKTRSEWARDTRDTAKNSIPDRFVRQLSKISARKLTCSNTAVHAIPDPSRDSLVPGEVLEPTRDDRIEEEAQQARTSSHRREVFGCSPSRRLQHSVL